MTNDFCALLGHERLFTGFWQIVHTKDAARTMTQRKGRVMSIVFHSTGVTVEEETDGRGVGPTHITP